MRKFLMTALLIVPMAGAAVGQTNRQQSARHRTDEQQIIAASRQLADDCVVNESSAVTHVSASHPKRITTAKDGEANPLQMDRVKVRINGDRAKLTSRLVFSGHRSNGETYERFDGWSVDLVKQGAQWQVAGARMGAVGK